MIMLIKGAFLFSLGSLPFAGAEPKKHHKGGGQQHDATSSTSSTESSSSSTSAPALRSHLTSEPHTPFVGTATTTGELTASSIGTGISSAGVAAEATSYPADGKLHHVQPAPYVPAGGVGTNGSTPVYNVKSDFDYQSLVCTQTNSYCIQRHYQGLTKSSTGSCVISRMDGI